MTDGSLKKIFLASVRPPRSSQEAMEEQRNRKTRPRALYDVPYMFEAREFLRKKVIGKKVTLFIWPKVLDMII